MYPRKLAQGIGADLPRTWVVLYPALECSDHEDRIYSQLSLMHPEVEIDPDYTKSLEDLFVEIVDKYIAMDWCEAEFAIVSLDPKLCARAEIFLRRKASQTAQIVS